MRFINWNRRSSLPEKRQRHVQVADARERHRCLVLAAAAVPAARARVRIGPLLVELGPGRDRPELGADLHVAPRADGEEPPPGRLAAIAEAPAVLEVADRVVEVELARDDVPLRPLQALQLADRALQRRDA